MRLLFLALLPAAMPRTAPGGLVQNRARGAVRAFGVGFQAGAEAVESLIGGGATEILWPDKSAAVPGPGVGLAFRTTVRG